MTGPRLRQDPPLATLLEAMGAELHSLGAMADRVQEALSPALSPAVLASPGVLPSLQDLDRLAQTARALATVATGLSDAAGRGEAFEAEAILAAVPLADLAFRLGATRPFEGSADEDWDDGFTIPALQPA